MVSVYQNHSSLTVTCLNMNLIADSCVLIARATATYRIELRLHCFNHCIYVLMY